jgi:hypothetical protein
MKAAVIAFAFGPNELSSLALVLPTVHFEKKNEKKIKKESWKEQKI